jgi:hypothetical protein
VPIRLHVERRVLHPEPTRATGGPVAAKRKLRVGVDAKRFLLPAQRIVTAQQRHPPGDPMTLGNMRALGVQRLVACCLNDACRHQGLTDMTKYPDDAEVPSFVSC